MKVGEGGDTPKIPLMVPFSRFWGRLLTGQIEWGPPTPAPPDGGGDVFPLCLFLLPEFMDFILVGKIIVVVNNKVEAFSANPLRN